MRQEAYLHHIDNLEAVCKDLIKRINDPATHNKSIFQDTYSFTRRRRNRLIRRFLKYYQKFEVLNMDDCEATILDNESGLTFHVWYDSEFHADGVDSYMEVFEDTIEYANSETKADIRIVALIEAEFEGWDAYDLGNRLFEYQVCAAESAYDAYYDR